MISLEKINNATHDKNDFLFVLRELMVEESSFDKVSKDTGHGKESLYKSLNPIKHPRIGTIIDILKALGLKIQVVEIPQGFKEKPKTIVRKGSLAHYNPGISAQWYHEKNGTTTPNDVMPTSKKKWWWRCPENFEHAWQATVFYRINKNRTCPYCEVYEQ